MEIERLGLIATILLAGSFLAWFVIGGEYNRRRAGTLARWIYRGLTPLGGKMLVRWLTTHAFEVFVEEAERPFHALKVTGLLESRDMLAVWLFNRFTYRPDLLVIRATLRRQPTTGMAAFRPRSVLAEDARRAARSAGWSPAPPDERGLEIWQDSAGSAARVQQLLATVNALGDELVLLALHQWEPHLVLAVSAARFARQEPRALFATFKHLAELAQA